MNKNKELWANDRKMHNLKYPDENVIRFLYHNRFPKTDVKILDFGCGSGRNTKVMSELGYHIFAMDYNKECLELTKEKLGDYPKIEYILNSELEVPLEENTIDCIVAWGSMFYLSRENEEKLFAGLTKVLKKDGLLLADYRAKDDWLYGCGSEIEPDFYQLDDSCGSLSGITYAFRDIDELIDLYKRMNMTIINYEKVEHYVDNCKKRNSHYIIWAKRDK